MLDAHSKAHKLRLDLCANLANATGALVCQDPGLVVSLAGPFSAGEFSFKVSGHVDHEHLENIFPPLKKELVTLNAAASITGRIAKQRNKSVSVFANVNVARLEASLPSIPTIKLLKPVDIVLRDTGIEIEDVAELAFAPGNLKVRGSVGREELDVHLDGQIPLVVSRFFVPIIQRSEGLAKGDVTLSGSFSQPLIEGTIVPEPRSVITFKKWLEAMEFREGAVSFHKTSPSSFITKFDNFKLGLGDGRLSVNGNFDKHYARKDAEAKSTFDLAVTGSNIVVRDKLDYVEADFTINTTHSTDSGAIVNGEITVTDGSAHRQFNLRNFVAQAQEGVRPGLAKALNAVDMKIALDIAVRQFRCLFAYARY